MTKRLIEIDDELLANAREQLGTSGVSDTVRESLRQAAAAAARARYIGWLMDGGMDALADPAERAKVWR